MNDYPDNEKGIHKGHRQRMKDKLVTHGSRIFDTYELLEMLLYYAVPHRDTNPLAKTLLATFGSLEGVLMASRDELIAVNGVGEHTADLILAAADMLCEGELASGVRADNVFDDYFNTGTYLTEYFAANPELTVTALLLDSSMRLLTTVDILGLDLNSAGVRSSRFVDPALSFGATVVILAHTRAHSALFPMPSDLNTVRMLSDDLGAVGIRVVEHYIVAGSSFIGVSEKLSIRLASDSRALSSFLDSKREGRQ